MNIIITSEHRCGSRWMHYMLADILNKNVSPEIDETKIIEKIKQIQRFFAENRIVKFHHASSEQIIRKLSGNYKIIGLVRNPRDRYVSLAFHNRYHPKKEVFKQHEFATDQEAVKYTVMEDEFAKQWTDHMFSYMLYRRSTMSKTFLDHYPYVWTSYEWMKEDTLGEMRTICTWLDPEIPDSLVKKCVKLHSFKSKSGREAGQEKRNDIWRRKGIVKDWENWFDDEMLAKTQKEHALYYSILETEKNGY